MRWRFILNILGVLLYFFRTDHHFPPVGWINIIQKAVASRQAKSVKKSKKVMKIIRNLLKRLLMPPSPNSAAAGPGWFWMSEN